MEKKKEGAVFLALLVFIQGVLGAVEIQPSINPAVAGDTVVLSLSPATALRSGSWAVGESLIATWFGDQMAVFPSHSGRASVNVLTGALTLTSATAADSGVYVVQSNDPQLMANTSITVLEPVSNVTIGTNHTDVTELSSAVMSCSVSSGSSLSFLWFNGSSAVSATDRVHLTAENSTVTIANVTRYDRGPFACRAFNPVSHGTSGSLNLSIIYGPDDMALTVNGRNSTSFSPGANLTVRCSAQSNPPAQFQWAFRGERVNATGPWLELYNVSEEHSGPYSCLAFNNQTNTHSNVTTHISISESPTSGCERRVNTRLLPVLPVVGLLSSWLRLSQTL